MNVIATGPIIPINKAFSLIEREKKQAIEIAAKEKDEKKKMEQKVGTKKAICAFYNKPNGCTKSDEECDFLHLKTAVMPNKMFEKKTPCLYFNTLKGCNKGDNCTFIHTKKTVENVDKKKEKLCDYFNTPKGCWKKDSCEFVHKKKESEYEPVMSTTSAITPPEWKLDHDEAALFNDWTSEWKTVPKKEKKEKKEKKVEPTAVDIVLCSVCSLLQATLLYEKDEVCLSCHNEKSEMMDLEEEAYHRAMSEICAMCVTFCGKLDKINEEMAYVTPSKKFNIARITTNMDEANEFFSICPTTITVNKFTFGSASLLMNKMFHAILREKLSSMCGRAHFMIKSEHDYSNSTTLLFVAAKKRYDI